VDKPAAWTSHDVVARLRKVYGQRRIGHAGTLDPDATGVLLVGLGRATRLLRYLQDAGKAYRARVVFGVATDTLDASGAVLERAAMELTSDVIAQAARAFVGEIEQIPPMVSAIKVGGRRLNELARAGEVVERAARRVRIDTLVVEDFVGGAYPEATIRIDCSSGTYVRSLAADLGTALGGCAHLGELRRLRVGSFVVDEAHTLDAVEADPERFVLTPATAVRDLPEVVVGEEQARAIAHGATFAAPALLGDLDAPGPFAVVDDLGELLALYERRGAGVKPALVLAPQESKCQDPK
jgi:tRNA pseudouridine55 synthase